MNVKILRAAAATLFLALAAGCAVLDPAAPDPGSDDGIQAAAMDGLSRDPMTAAANLLVSVDNGLATLTGTVPNTAVRQRAIQILERTDGIFEVRDHTRVF
ncbi:MAG: BON domain-containing protein [Kiritimatiellae bacterium]|nr:BON domain-containing protein [Kiritimatiellia bacterium]